jgi:hypothetical protein
MIQFHSFHDGSFVLHKIMLNGQKYSAWFNADGTFKDGERVLRDGSTRNVSVKHTIIRGELERRARPYRDYQESELARMEADIIGVALANNWGFGGESTNV